jgi:hypothetical protein
MHELLVALDGCSCIMVARAAQREIAKLRKELLELIDDKI